MATKKSTPSWSDVKTKLVDFDRAGLLGLLQELYSANKDNQAFLHARLSLGDDVLKPYKVTIELTDRDLRLHLVHLAAEGLMWQELFQMYSMPAPARAKLVALMEELAREWGTQPATKRIAKEA